MGFIQKQSPFTSDAEDKKRSFKRYKTIKLFTTTYRNLINAENGFVLNHYSIDASINLVLRQ